MSQPKSYLIREGSFRMPDGSLKSAGETVELPSDVAADHAGRLEEVKPPEDAHAAAAATGRLLIGG